MARRSEPANEAVKFFETASPETARVVFAIIKGIVERKQPPRVQRLSPTRVAKAIARTLPTGVETP